MFSESVWKVLGGRYLYYGFFFAAAYLAVAAAVYLLASLSVKNNAARGKKEAAFTASPELKTRGKRVIKAVICETPLRRTEMIAMQNTGGEEVLGEKYLKSCIRLLKCKDLAEYDAEKLSLCEKNLSFPLKADTAADKKKLCEACGGIITLLAKYK